MRELKYSIDNNGHGLIEMPCGTGKTITILSFLIAYKRKRPDIINKIGQGFFNIFTARWSNGGGAPVHLVHVRLHTFMSKGELLNPSKIFNVLLNVA